jgi:hypothetical protein
MVPYQLETGFFKWKVTYIYRDSEESLEVWADNIDDAIEQAILELAKMDKLTDCTIQNVQRVDIEE